MKRRNLRVEIVSMICILFVFCMGQVFSEECGDVNSSKAIDIVDALLIAQHYVGLNPTNFDLSVADVDADGFIDIVDDLLVAQLYTGLLDILPRYNQTPAPTNEPAQVTTSDPADPSETVDCSESTIWSPNTIYETSGSRVTYNGNLYENKWYTVNENPEEYSGPEYAWKLIGACDPNTIPDPSEAVDCSKSTTWSPNTIYETSGSRVIYDGNLYENKWYTVDENPEEYSGPEYAWKLIGTCDPNTVPKPTNPPIPGANGYATRFWDCCKPHCSWPNNLPSSMPPLQTCAIDGVTTQSDPLLNSSCGAGGPAYVCYKLIPWAVNSNLSYGYAATSSGDICGRCFELEFTGEGYYGWSPGADAIQGKKMIVQAINIGYDVEGGQVDIMVPGGGVGLYDGCSTQWGIPTSELGVQYGGLLSACQEQYGYQDLAALKNCLRDKNDSLFRSRGLTEMAQGLDWFIDWYEAADNPEIITTEVPCPQELEAISGLQRP